MSIFNFDPPIIAHRGASAYAPENTLSAFLKAAEMGAQWIECDIMQSASGELVIFHDEDLVRTTNGSGLLHESSYAYLKTLDAGSWFHSSFSGERIPSLQNFLQFLSNTGLCANIEIKARLGDEERMIARLQKEIKNCLDKHHHRILFSSFSLKSLQFLHTYLPNAYIGVLIDQWEVDLDINKLDKLFDCVSFHVNETILTKDKAKFIKEKGKILLAYTVNSKKRAEQLFSFGVDAIFTDQPDILLG